MATVREFQTKTKGIGFRFQVKIPNRKKPETKTWYPEANTPLAKARVQAEIEAKAFEKQVKKEILGNKYLLENPDITFAEFSNIWLEKAEKYNSLSYFVNSSSLLEEINQAIGNYPIRDLGPNEIQDYYNSLDSKIKTTYKITPKIDLKTTLKAHGFNYNRLRYDLKIQSNTLSRAYNGKNVSKDWADNLSFKTGIPLDKLFDVEIIKQPYAYETIDKYKRTIRAILSYAKKKRIVDENYATAEYIDFPKKPPDNKKKGMTYEESIKLVSFLMGYDDIQAKTGILTLLLTGMRKGEVSGLEWKDIDFNNRIISVNRSITTVKGHGAVEGPTKNGSSLRSFTMSPALAGFLLKYKEWQEKRKEDLGDLWVETDKVFTKVHGESIYPSYFNAQLNKVLELTELSHYSVHKLRKTNIALLMSEGVDVSTVSSRAGHARTSTTVDMYSYALPHADRIAANKLDETLLPNSEKDSNNKANDNEDVKEYRKAKTEMARLGFEDYDEYLDYLEFMEKKTSRQKN